MSCCFLHWCYLSFLGTPSLKYHSVKSSGAVGWWRYHYVPLKCRRTYWYVIDRSVCSTVSCVCDGEGEVLVDRLLDRERAAGFHKYNLFYIWNGMHLWQQLRLWVLVSSSLHIWTLQLSPLFSEKAFSGCMDIVNEKSVFQVQRQVLNCTHMLFLKPFLLLWLYGKQIFSNLKLYVYAPLPFGKMHLILISKSLNINWMKIYSSVLKTLIFQRNKLFTQQINIINSPLSCRYKEPGGGTVNVLRLKWSIAQ